MPIVTTNKIELYPTYRKVTGRKTLYEGSYTVLKTHPLGDNSRLLEVRLEKPVLYATALNTSLRETDTAIILQRDK